MRRVLPRLSRAFACVVLLLPSMAGAEPFAVAVQVRGGAITVTPEASIRGAIGLDGTPTFRFDASFDSGSSEALCFPCVPGESISLGSLIAAPFSGTLNDGVRTHPFSFDVGGGQLLLTAPGFVLPVPAGNTARFETPFSLSGFFFNGEPENVTTFNVAGRGRVTGTFGVFSLDPDGGRPAYQLRQLHYDFSPDPVPEPATLGLVGAGIAATALRIRRRRQPR